MYRKSSYIEQQIESRTYTASIDVLRNYGYRDEWHLSAIEFHHKDKNEAEKLRDQVFDLLTGTVAN
jgi:hypothetical protein